MATSETNLLDSIMERMGIDPLQNLIILSEYLASATHTNGSFIMLDDTIVASSGGFVPLPESALRIPIEMKDFNSGVEYERRLNVNYYQQTKNYLCFQRKDSCYDDGFCDKAQAVSEEFVVLLTNTDSENTADIAERIRVSLFNAKILGDKRDVTLSLGLASYPKHASTRKTFIERADKALYIAKKNGRNKYEIWDDKFNDVVIAKSVEREFISGDMIKDAGRMLVMFSVLEIARQNTGIPEKINAAPNKIFDASDASGAYLLIVEDSKITEEHHVAQKDYNAVYSEQIVETVINTKEAIFMVDWDKDVPDASGMSDWQSVAAALIIANGALYGVLYLSVSVKNKEFTSDEAGFIYYAATLLSTVINHRGGEINEVNK